MKRSAPLRSGKGFKPKVPPRREAKQLGAGYTLRRRATGCVISGTVARACVPVPKLVYVRSPAILEACRILACQHCGANDGTVCAAHSNWAIHGKAKSKKASDVFVASLCFRCHGDIDQGSRLSRPARQALWWRAHIKTVALLVGLNLWPRGIEVPNLAFNPFTDERETAEDEL